MDMKAREIKQVKGEFMWIKAWFVKETTKGVCKVCSVFKGTSICVIIQPSFLFRSHPERWLSNRQTDKNGQKMDDQTQKMTIKSHFLRAEREG